MEVGMQTGSNCWLSQEWEQKLYEMAIEKQIRVVEGNETLNKYTKNFTLLRFPKTCSQKNWERFQISNFCWSGT